MRKLFYFGTKDFSRYNPKEIHKWFIELFEDTECRNILEEKYNFKLTDFYKMNTEPMYFDQVIIDIAKRQQAIIKKYQEEKKNQIQ